MNHEELLAAVKDNPTTRAVVELHKPVMAFTGGYDGEENEIWAEQCSNCSGNGFSQMYPCSTIQQIIENLK